MFEEKFNSNFPIMDMLPFGRENAISTAELVKLIGCKSGRELQERIAKERSAGAIICSGSGRGYWRPQNRQEIVNFVRTMEARAKNTLAAASGAKKALRVADGQVELGEGDGCLM